MLYYLQSKYYFSTFKNIFVLLKTLWSHTYMNTQTQSLTDRRTHKHWALPTDGHTNTQALQKIEGHNLLNSKAVPIIVYYPSITEWLEPILASNCTVIVLAYYVFRTYRILSWIGYNARNSSRKINEFLSLDKAA